MKHGEGEEGEALTEGEEERQPKKSLEGRSECLGRKRQADSRGETGSSIKTQNNEGLRRSCSLEEQPGDTQPEMDGWSRDNRQTEQTGTER